MAQARSQVYGNGQQIVTLELSTGADSEQGRHFELTLEYGRVGSQGAALDAGQVVAMSCSFAWYDGGDDFGIGGDCNVRRSGGGYALTIDERYGEGSALSGTFEFGPVPNVPGTYTPGNGCPSGVRVEREADRVHCMPTTNLKSQASPCSADCDAQVRITVGGSATCVCSSVCGYVASGSGGDPPTCDPACGRRPGRRRPTR